MERPSWNRPSGSNIAIAPAMVSPSKIPQLKSRPVGRLEIVIQVNDGAVPWLRPAPSLRRAGEQSQSHAAVPFIASPLSK